MVFDGTRNKNRHKIPSHTYKEQMIYVAQSFASNAARVSLGTANWHHHRSGCQPSVLALSSYHEEDEVSVSVGIG